MPPFELPPARTYLYERVTIDLRCYVAIHPDGAETPLTGQAAELLALLLEHPGRVLTYQYLGLSLMPCFAGEYTTGPGDLDPQQLAGIKHAMQSLVHRARAALGERPGSRSLIINRGNLGYAIRLPLCVICDPHGARCVPQHTPQPMSRYGHL
jgi:DNA-binding response OmpR family regulator